MSTTEKNLIVLLLLFTVLAGSIFLARRTLKRTHNLKELHRRVIFSSSSFTGRANRARLIFDRNPATAWYEKENFPLPKRRGRFKSQKNFRSPVPHPETLFIGMDLGLTHFPGNPPVRNMPTRLILWSGNQKNALTFKEYARPRLIRIAFFKQRLVDVDREYAIPGPPIFWGSTLMNLADRAGAQILKLDFLPPVPDSKKFPHNIFQVWALMTIETYYPGSRYTNQPAISEADIIRPLPAHTPIKDCIRKSVQAACANPP